MPLTQELAAFCAALRYEDLPADALPFIRTGFADCFATMVAGRHEAAVRMLREALDPGPGPSRLLLDLGTATRTITVTSPQVTATIGGQITGSAGIAKSGDGILVLSQAANDYTGGTTVSNGTLALGATNAAPGVLTISGGTFDLTTFNSTPTSVAITSRDTASTPRIPNRSVAAGALPL
mgnify:CR=1 FL=1